MSMCKIGAPGALLVWNVLLLSASNTFSSNTMLLKRKVSESDASIHLAGHTSTLIAAADFDEDHLRSAVAGWTSDATRAYTQQIYGPINEWVTSRVTSMANLFRDKPDFNDDIDTWQTGAVTDMSHMFCGAVSFNQPLSSWQMSSVTSIASMFSSCLDTSDCSPTCFNQNINSWQIGFVTNMHATFYEAEAFNQPLQSWQTKSVEDIHAMFFKARSFNQNINSWQIDSVFKMANTFAHASAFNQNINTWKTASITSFLRTFTHAVAFNQPLGAWQTSSVTSMSEMFNGAGAFNQNISSWETGSVMTMFKMFGFTRAFNQNINSWRTGNATKLRSMFENARAFNQPLHSWKIESATCIHSIFYHATVFNQNINTWRGGSVTDMMNAFGYARAFNQPMDSWQTTKVIDLSRVFQGALSFNQDIDSWQITSATAMNRMFENATSFDLSLASWDIAGVKSMSSMFSGADSLSNCNKGLMENSWRCSVAFVKAICGRWLGLASQCPVLGPSMPFAETSPRSHTPVALNSNNSNEERKATMTPVECTTKDKNSITTVRTIEHTSTITVSNTIKSSRRTITDSAAKTTILPSTLKPEPEPSTNHQRDIYSLRLGLCFALGFAFILFIAFAFKWYRGRHQHQGSVFVSPSHFEMQMPESTENDLDYTSAYAIMAELGVFNDDSGTSLPRPREIQSSHVCLVEVIGTGHFGKVWKAILDEGVVPAYTCAVKVSQEQKSLQSNSTATQNLQSEAAIMSYVPYHPHLVSLIGVVVAHTSFMVVMSHCEHGSLDSFLQRAAGYGAGTDPCAAQTHAGSTPVTLLVKLRMGLEVCMAMEHLSSKRIVHCDLSARNVLVATGMVCKVADFGMSRITRRKQHSHFAGIMETKIDVQEYFKHSPDKELMFACRWTDPEVIRTGKWNQASDVWSFGILLIEIMTNGTNPYVDIKNPMELFVMLTKGFRHPRPPKCPENLYRIICECWAEDLEARPTFSALIRQLVAVKHANKRVGHGVTGARNINDNRDGNAVTSKDDGDKHYLQARK